MTRPAPPKSRKAAPQPPASRIAEVASTLVGSRRRNAQALLDAGRKSCSGAAAIVERRIEILRDTLGELQTVAKVMQHAGARESAAHLDGLARGVLQLALNSIGELTSLASAKQKETLETLVRRLQADLAEFRQLRSKRSAASAK